MTKKQTLSMRIVYDNNPYNEILKPDWGFSCFISGLEKSILFDTGTKGNILLSNMEKMGILPDDIDVVFLSHDHKDHTGGLESLLEKNSEIEVWVPAFFSSNFKKSIKKKGANFIDVQKLRKICEGAYTTGVITGWINEQSLVLETNEGLVLMTGCSHPRIANIITIVKDLFKKDIFMVLGGFHLAGFENAEIKEIIGVFRSINVKKTGLCHCSGDDARRLFAKEYKDDYIDIGVGKEIVIE